MKPNKGRYFTGKKCIQILYELQVTEKYYRFERRKHIDLMPLILCIEKKRDERRELKRKMVDDAFSISIFFWKGYRCLDDVLNKMIVVNVLCACD